MEENKLYNDYRIRIWSNEIQDYLGRETHTLGSYYSLQNGNLVGSSLEVVGNKHQNPMLVPKNKWLNLCFGIINL